MKLGGFLLGDDANSVSLPLLQTQEYMQLSVCSKKC